MNKFVSTTLLLAINLILLATGEAKSVFEDPNKGNQILPPTNYAGVNIPGTKWCGIGNSGEDYDDLGRFNETDKCCRDHTHCEEIIEPFTTMHSLFNPSILPKFSCKCEQELMSCLQKVNDMPSTVIGKSYYSVMSQCFAKDYPVVECMEYQEGRLGKRCITYKFNETQEQEYQFFDLPYYIVKEE